MEVKFLLKDKLKNSSGIKGFISSITKSNKEDIKNMRNKILEITSHIECEKFAERVFLVLFDMNERPLCTCGNTLKYLDFSQGYRKYCSVKCSLSDPIVINKITIHKKTLEYRNKMRILTSRGLYGFGSEKYKNTIKERYGVENISQDDKIHQKQHAVRSKIFTFPDGRIETVQGYETFAINELLKTYDSDDIIINLSEIRDNIGRFFYFLDDKKKTYHPDIYIKSEKKIIEVKSDWTLCKELDINLLKKQAVIEKGYKFEFMVYDKTGNNITDNLQHII